MNEFFSELFRDKTVKSTPDIWFEKVALFRDVEKEPIRTILLKKGLNVVQAGDDSAHDEISGHEQNEAKAADEKKQAETRLAVLISQEDQMLKEIDDLKKDVQKFKEGLDTNFTLLRNIKEAHNKIILWRNKRNYDPELVDAKNDLTCTSADLVKTQQHLSGLMTTHKVNTETMKSVFNRLVKSILSSDHYHGNVELTDERELSFSIFYMKNPSVSIAINVLKTVLADIASLIYASITNNANYPRFLIHDSPREADLQRSHYNAVFGILPMVQSLFSEHGGIPFQYIITTTTPPPECITSEFLTIPILDARDPDKILLKCRLDEEYRKEQERDSLLTMDNVE